jgi:hypothetical protein
VTGPTYLAQYAFVDGVVASDVLIETDARPG